MTVQTENNPNLKAKSSQLKALIGFIGQGFIGMNYANDFENRGFKVVRYSVEPQYVNNKDKIKDCDIVFIAVPTPTTPEGFDFSVVKNVISLIGRGKVAVIKSTLLPGTTESIQKENPDIFVLHSPEFLTAAKASEEAANPKRNIVGVPIDTEEYKQKAQMVIDILPKAPYEQICHSNESELIKYGSNVFYYIKVIYANLVHDFALKVGADWEEVKKGMLADPWIVAPNDPMHFDPVHKGGRGAGSGCLVKDFAAFARMYEEITGDKTGAKLLHSFENKNIELLKKSGKDLELVKGVYGQL